MRRLALLLLSCVLIATTRASHAQTFTTLLDFDWSNGALPEASLIQATDGNLYGTTFASAASGNGEVFRITLDGTLTVLNSFSVYGQLVKGGLLQGVDGNLYGTTYGDAAKLAYGTVFKMTPQGTLTTLHSFCPGYDCSEGAFPRGALVQLTDGNFYGTTAGYDYYGICGGACGTVFKITPQGTLTTLHHFTAGDGANPYAGLLLANDGNFYGTTSRGSNATCQYGCGTVFRITPQGQFTTIYSFSGSDGANPYAKLVQGADGYLYGSTYNGGSSNANCDAGCGTLFRMTLNGTLTTIHRFRWTDGAYPAAELVQGSDGNFYGTTAGYHIWLSCGEMCGTLFQITPQGTLTTLHQFSYDDGANPYAGLVQATDGNYYGGTSSGGSYSYGTIFRLEPYAVLSVSNSGSGTAASSDGHIYCGATCSYAYLAETQVALSAVPSPGYTFDGWSGCDQVNGSYCSVTMTSAKNVTATFTTADVILTSLTLKPSYVKGGQVSAGTLTLKNAAPPGGVTVALSSDHPGVVHPPSYVFIPGGNTSIGFAVYTVPVKSTTAVNITATAGSSHVSGTLMVGTTSLPPSLR